jgi:hypothetical protein
VLRQSSPKTPDQSPLLGGAQGKEIKKQIVNQGGQHVAHLGTLTYTTFRVCTLN